MTTPSRINGDIQHTGNISFGSGGSITLPAGTVTNASIGSGQNVGAAKLQHRFRPPYAQPKGVAVAADDRAIYYALTTGTINYIYVGALTAAIGDSTLTVDLKKNGSSILTGTISLTSATVAFATLTGTLSSAALTAGDVLEVVVTVAANTGTLAKGVFVVVEIDENGV